MKGPCKILRANLQKLRHGMDALVGAVHGEALSNFVDTFDRDGFDPERGRGGEGQGSSTAATALIVQLL